MLTQIVLVLASAPIGAGSWLWLAWANGRGYGWARAVFAALFGLLTLGLLFGVAEGDTKGTLPDVTADLIATTALWLVALVTMPLIFGNAASPHYQQETAQH